MYDQETATRIWQLYRGMEASPEKTEVFWLLATGMWQEAVARMLQQK